MRLLFIFLLTLSTIGGYGQCQWDDFKKATDDATPEGRVLTDTFDENPELIDNWEDLHNLEVDEVLRNDPDFLKNVNDWDGGGATLSKNADGNLDLSDGAGNKIGEVKNGDILPEVGKDATNGGTPIGDPKNGYQLVDDAGELKLKRVPDQSGYNTSELTELTQHPNAHVLERHGHDVTDDALVRRANTGVAPDGSRTASGNPPPYSSKFDNPQKVVEALNNTKPGTTAFINGVQQGNRRIVRYTSNVGDFGKGVPRNGNVFETTDKVLAIYQDLGGGNYQLLTMYPDF